MRLRQFLKNNRRHPISRWVARRAKRLLAAYDNLDYDISGNGELWLLRQISQMDSPVLLDVGANQGEWALCAKRVIAHAKIHCFEICPETFNKLERRVHGDEGISINPFGLSQEAGTVQIKYFPSDDGKTSLFDYPHPKSSRFVTGEVRTGDAYLREQDIPHVHLLKIDTEGAEHFVLHGFVQALASHKIDLIQFEYGRVNILSRFLLKDYYDLFTHHGYVLGKLYPNHIDFKPYTLEDEDFLGPNYVACRNDLVGLIAQLKC